MVTSSVSPLALTTSSSSSSITRHSDIYSAILQLLVSSGPSSVRVLRLRAYTRAELHSAAEKSLVAGLVSQLGRLEVLELGHAVDDEILREVGRSCPRVRTLKVAGPAVTDTGLSLLCREGAQSGLCRSLTSLSVLGTSLLTVEAVLQALQHLQLSELSLQENLVLQILRREEKQVLPIRQLEVTVGPGRRDYLSPASSMAPLLSSITLWCFESENVSSLSGTELSSAEISLRHDYHRL